jgi:hypothetical protein
MTDPHWTSYVGMITGIIGSLTGILGAVLGFVGFRRANKLKSLDLRIEVQKARNDAHFSNVQLVDLLEAAKSSRTATARVNGTSHSRGLQQFEEKFDTDRKHAADLISQIPKPGFDFSSLSVEELETKLVEIHRLQCWINDVSKYYEGTIAEDDEDQNQYREFNQRELDRHRNNR